MAQYDLHDHGLEAGPDAKGHTSGRRSQRTWLALLAVVATAAFAGLVSYLAAFGPDVPSHEDIVGYAEHMGAFARSAGLSGVGVVIVLYALGVVVAVPSSMLTLAVTLAYGLWAIPVAWFGALLGLALAFVLARTALSDFVQELCRRYRVTRGMEAAFRERGFWLVLLMRQSPVIPFAAQNYLFGMLGTRVRDYLIGSALGLVPGTLAKVVIFDSARMAVTASPTPSAILLGALGVVATVVVMVILARAVRAELTRVDKT